jgi:CheY-like chemotaxis protein
MLAINTQKRNEDNNKKKRILVIDDELDILLVLQLVLEQAGFKVSSFDNALTALSNFEIGLYDLAILDVKMPQMNGFQLYEKIIEVDRSVKVCFITAAAIEEAYYYDGQFTEKKERKESEEENGRQISEQRQSQKQQQQYFREFNKATFLKKPISNGDLIRQVNTILTS